MPKQYTKKNSKSRIRIFNRADYIDTKMNIV